MSSSMKRKRTDEGSGSRRFTKKKSAAKGRTSSSRAIRPALQIQSFVSAGAATIAVPTGGVCHLLSSYSRGSGEGDRHTNETVTYKAAFDYHFSANAGPRAYSSIGVGVSWLVYDDQPSGQVPAVIDIFRHDTTLQSFPYTWKVGREVCHRFVVKRRWCFTMETNGRIGSDKPPSNAVWPPCKRSIYFHKFATGLGVKTEWKNTTDGGVGSIKKGALYFVIAPGSGIDFTLFGTCRMYFKSVGNQ
nr:coat protein [Digitaria streak virus]